MKKILLKILRLGFFGLIVLVTVVALVIAEENYRGKRAWESYCREKEAKGERLDFRLQVPAPVPDEQNFAMTPLLRPLFENHPDYAERLTKKLELPPAAPNAPRPYMGDRVRREKADLGAWKGYFGGKEVLVALERFDGELREISEAARRPYCRFPQNEEQIFFLGFPYTRVAVNLGKLYALRACAELSQGSAEAARDDVETLGRLASVTKAEPIMISVLTRVSILRLTEQVVWEGLIDHRWSEGQLAAIQETLAGQDLVAGVEAALRSERVGCNALLLQSVADPGLLPRIMGSPQGNTILEHLPRGVIYQNLVTYNQAWDAIRRPSDYASLRAFTERFREEATRLKLSSYLPITRAQILNPRTSLAAMAMPGLEAAMQFVLQTQVSVDEAVAACALERYRMANGKYPESLEALVPAYLPAVPRDAASSGGQLLYKPQPGGGFLLYSVGWNGADDGGKRVFDRNDAYDPNRGDWVW